MITQFHTPLSVYKLLFRSYVNQMNNYNTTLLLQGCIQVICKNTLNTLHQQEHTSAHCFRTILII